MSNHVTIQATRFTNLPQGTETLGFRIYDDYNAAYCNTLESIPENDIELLELILGDYASDDTTDILSYVEEHEKGIEINGNYYSWDEIAPSFEKVYS
jgi:hypothetical protein